MVLLYNMAQEETFAKGVKIGIITVIEKVAIVHLNPTTGSIGA